jgi:hypothetical protein
MNDFSFDNSVWSTGDSFAAPSSSTAQNVPVADDAFDDFGDPAPVLSSADDDGFGDFGDFGEVGASEGFGFEDTGGFGNGGFGDTVFQQKPPVSWEPLQVDPLPSREELFSELNDLLEPIFAHIDLDLILTQEPIRQAEGLNQVLTTPESRAVYRILLQTLPPTRPVNWIRSKIRRKHLISLGIPVNLDEVLPQANGKPMPALHITTRPQSAPPGAHPSISRPGTPAGGRPGTPQPNSTRSPPESALAPKPKLDYGKISEMLPLQSDTLSLLPLPTLEAHLATLRNLTSSTSLALAHLLQTRESLQQDSETYNRLIAELISDAQKKGPRSRVVKRGSGI